MPASAITAAERKALSRKVGKDLIENYGKKKYYSKAMVDGAMRRQALNLDWSCWSYSLFTSPSEFSEIHHRLGETCDYASMRSKMVSDATDGASGSWFDVDMSWLDWPDFDFGSAFDFFD